MPNTLTPTQAAAPVAASVEAIQGLLERMAALEKKLAAVPNDPSNELETIDPYPDKTPTKILVVRPAGLPKGYKGIDGQGTFALGNHKDWTEGTVVNTTKSHAEALIKHGLAKAVSLLLFLALCAATVFNSRACQPTPISQAATKRTLHHEPPPQTCQLIT